MKYTYQDSTELPYQRDFVQDMKNLIEVTTKVISLENSAIEMNDEEKSETILLKNRLYDLDKFEADLKKFIEDASKDADAKEILEFRNTVIDSCVASAAKSRETLNQEIERSQKVSTREVGRLESQMLSLLSLIFEAGVYGAKKSYSASMIDNVFRGTLKASIDGMDYESNIIFANDVLTVKGLYKELSLPTWAKAGLLQKDDKVKSVDVSDFIIKSINYNNSGDMECIFENKKSERKFKITGNNFDYRVYDEDYDITGDDELSKLLNKGEISEFADEAKTYVQEYIKSQTLTRVLIDGKDAIRNNEVFDCLKLIAQQYGDIVKECLERGYVKSEITIKIEQIDGTRTEKYVSKNEVFNQLAEIGSEGLELAGILGVEE
ncbi:MAG: hypothetical protein P1P69_01245 [Methanosarcinaceae archaeon]|nr:hypothetical protein [Methanosarcinaceae archaeon]